MTTKKEQQTGNDALRVPLHITQAMLDNPIYNGKRAPLVTALRTGLDQALPGRWMAYYPLQNNAIRILLSNRTLWSADLPPFMVEWAIDYHAGERMFPIRFDLFFRWFATVDPFTNLRTQDKEGLLLDLKFANTSPVT